MAKIVLGNIEKLDFRTTLEKVKIIESVDELVGHIDDETYILEYTDEHVQAICDGKHEVYLPASALITDHQHFDGKIYFDLENYPFYQKAEELIRKETKPKGVLRFKRTTNQAVNEALIAEDIYVFSSLLGEPIDVQVRQTDSAVRPTHVILMINFGGGTMAHVEYTFTQTDDEHMEFEWSGVKHIIEFDSEALKPIRPGDRRNVTLIYPADSILQKAHQVNVELIERLNDCKKLINGGAK